MNHDQKQQMSGECGGAEAKAGACVYILHMLLQRLENSSPGLVEGLLEGAAADRDAIKRSGAMTESLEGVFEETLGLLERVHAQNQMKCQ